MKISREKLRALIREQVELMSDGTGPFLVLVFDEDSRKTQVFITKVLPDDQWWHAPSDELDAADMGMDPGFGGRDGARTLEKNCIFVLKGIFNKELFLENKI